MATFTPSMYPDDTKNLKIVIYIATDVYLHVSVTVNMLK